MSGSKLLIRNWRNSDSDSDSDSYNNTLTQEIINKLKNSSNKEVSKLGNQLAISHRENSKKINRKIYRLVEQLETTGSSSQHTTLNISDSNYKELVKQRQSGNISRDENKVLEVALFAKVCNCVKKRLSQSTAQWLLGKMPENVELDDLPYNPYAICSHSIYNSRGFRRTKSFSDCS